MTTLTVLAAPEPVEHATGGIADRCRAPSSITSIRAPVAVAADANLHRGAGRRVLADVRQQVREHLAQRRLVADHVHRLRRDQRDRPVGLDRARVVHRVGGERAEIDVGELERSAFVEPRQRQQVVDEATHAHRLVLDARRRARVVSASPRQRTRAQQLGVARESR